MINQIDVFSVTSYIIMCCKDGVLEYLKVMAKGVNIVDYAANKQMIVSGHSSDGFVHFQVIEAVPVL